MMQNLSKIRALSINIENCDFFNQANIENYRINSPCLVNYVIKMIDFPNHNIKLYALKVKLMFLSIFNNE